MSLPKDIRLQSILDTDLYKFAQQYAVLKLGDVEVSYEFTNRSPDMKFSKECVDVFQQGIAHLAELSLKPEERKFFESKCDYLPSTYFDWLEKFRFRPSEQIHLSYDEEAGSIELVVQGLWAETILYDVPLMALLSESYFTTVDTQWDMRGQRENAYRKGKALFEAGCSLVELGIRRRRSFEAERVVVEGLRQADREGTLASGALTGTSNLHLARLIDQNLFPPVYGHEWIMGIAALTGYKGANTRAMQSWEETYPGQPMGGHLPDTFTSAPFWVNKSPWSDQAGGLNVRQDEFTADPERVKRWDGLRQDSGDPFAFADLAHKTYKSLGLDPSKKLIYFADALDVHKCIQINAYCRKLGLGCAFGMGTNLTNDFKIVTTPLSQSTSHLGDGEPRDGDKSRPLNIVIKLATVNGKRCVKISDDPGKATRDKDAVLMAKRELGI